MIRIPPCQRAACTLAAALSLAACGTTAQQDAAPVAVAEPAASYYIGGEDVFAHLDSRSGGSWVFTKITDSDAQPAKGYLVRLNDLAPAFDTRVAECEPQNYPTDHKCSPANPFRDKDVGVFEKIISGGIAAGTAGKVTNVSRTYETSFDATAFNQAVDEALTNTGLVTERRELLAALETYQRLAAESRTTLDGLIAEYDADYEDTAGVPVQIQADVTGLVEYYSNDIDLRSLVELIPRASAAGALRPGEPHQLLPCDPRQCLRQAREAIASVEADTEFRRVQLLENIDSGRHVYDVRCEKTTYAGYVFTLECPAEIEIADEEPASLPVSLHILARDFDALYPDIDIRDDNLSVTVAGEDVAFTNLTASYVAVKAQTVYYNSRVHTNSSAINIAPGATVTRPIAQLVSSAIDVESSYRNMTPDKASNASFEFGIAAKYRVAGEARDVTLYDFRTFNVGCAIADRVTPGSCEHTSKEETAARQNAPSSF